MRLKSGHELSLESFPLNAQRMNPYQPPAEELLKRPERKWTSSLLSRIEDQANTIAAIGGLVTIIFVTLVYAIDWWIHH